MKTKRTIKRALQFAAFRERPHAIGSGAFLRIIELGEVISLRNVFKLIYL